MTDYPFDPHWPAGPKPFDRLPHPERRALGGVERGTMTEEQLMRAFEALKGASQRIDQGLTRVAQAQLEDGRRAWATERLILGLAAVVAEQSADPFALMDKVRFFALDGLPADDSGPTNAMRAPVEQLLAKLEAFVVTLPPAPHEP
jgi:hypothetical protein